MYAQAFQEHDEKKERKRESYMLVMSPQVQKYPKRGTCHTKSFASIFHTLAHILIRCI